MRNFYATLLCYLAAAVAGLAQEAEKWYLDAPEGAEFNVATGVAIATNGITVRYAGSTLTARRASVNQQTGLAVAEGDVHIERAGQVWAGERVEYNFKTRHLAAEEADTAYHDGPTAREWRPETCRRRGPVCRAAGD